MNFTLVHSFFAWLLPLASLPIIFHLFYRIKKRPRPFSTLMFFHRIDPRLSARRKIMEWIVLALRTLLILFLLMALGAPCPMVRRVWRMIRSISAKEARASSGLMGGDCGVSIEHSVGQR